MGDAGAGLNVLVLSGGRERSDLSTITGARRRDGHVLCWVRGRRRAADSAFKTAGSGPEPGGIARGDRAVCRRHVVGAGRMQGYSGRR